MPASKTAAAVKEFGMFETTISAFVDEFPGLLQKRKIAFTAFVCFILFLCGIPCITQGGMYVLQLMDWYSATFSLMIISFFECIVIGWIYGADRFMADINLMTGKVPPFWWKLCWCYITPITILSLLLFILINHVPVTYGSYQYPPWAIGVGWVMAILSIIPIPIFAISRLIQTRGNIAECLRPMPVWGPALEENRLLYQKSLSEIPSNFRQSHVARSNRPQGETNEVISLSEV